jgi:hypothetical protein
VEMLNFEVQAESRHRPNHLLRSRPE